MSGYEVGDCSRQTEQPQGRRGRQLMLDRVTDKTLAEAERKALHFVMTSFKI